MSGLILVTGPSTSVDVDGAGAARLDSRHDVNQPLFWSLLVGAAALGMAARLAFGGPVMPRRAVGIGPAWLAVAGISALGLALHCAAMFFAPWTDAVLGGQALGTAIRELGPASQAAYWLPAAALVPSLRRVWWPALLLLAATLTGVGITMFWPYTLVTHLSWLAAAVLTTTFIAVSLISASAHPPAAVPTG